VHDARVKVGPPQPRTVDDIDWATWRPVDPATLLFVLEGPKILLIRKKRGLGAGKINGPGGRIEPGETPLQGAVREVEEEVGITPAHPQDRGVLRFQFVDGYSLQVHVFVATAHVGVVCETAEAIPHWIDIAAIPYDEMWADDRLWLPHVLDGRAVDGRFVFDGDLMIDHALRVQPPR
jgi:8-oxo-dGTP diphosphatase